MQILIPAGGRGVRLRPLTNHTPKPLLPLGDRPILTRIVEALPDNCPIHVLVSPALAAEFHAWHAPLSSDRDVRIFVEPEAPGGPAGPVVALAGCLAQDAAADDLLVLMGDSIPPFSIEEFLSHARGGPCVAAYKLPNLEDASRFGVLEFDAAGMLTAFVEKPAQPRSPWIFTGCLFLPARLLPALHRFAAGRPPQMGELVAHYLEAGEAIRVFPVTAAWHDIGTFASYLEAHAALLTAGERRALQERGNHLEGTVYVHPEARVSGSRLCDSIILAGAEVRDAELTGCVVQGGVSVAGRAVRRMLITPEEELGLHG